MANINKKYHFMFIILILLISSTIQDDDISTSVISTDITTTDAPTSEPTTNETTEVISTILTTEEISTILTTEETTSLITDNSSTSIISTDISSTDIEPNSTNSTIKFTPKSSGGLSAGGIVAIVLPCVAALGAAGAAAILFGRSAKAPTPITMDSTMGTINTQPITTVNNNVKDVQVIQPSPVVQQHPIYPVNKQPPSYPDVVQINVSGQKINNVVKNPQTNTRHIILGSQNQLMSPKALNGVKNPQIISKSIPNNVTINSQIINQSQTVPVKVLPVVEQGNV